MLDGFDKEGQEVISDEEEYGDEEDYGDENGEFIDEDEIDEETLQKLKE